MNSDQMETCIAAAEAIGYYNDKFYFVPYFERNLYAMNEDFGGLEYLTTLEDDWSEALYQGIVGYKQRVILVPRCAGRIAIYDMIARQVNYLEFGEYRTDHYSLFSSFHVVGNTLFLIPLDFDSIILVDLDTDEVNRIEIRPTDEKRLICGGQSCRKDEIIYFPDRDDKCIWEFNILEKNVKKCEFIANPLDCSFLYIVDDYMWILPDNLQNDVIRINLSDHSQICFRTEEYSGHRCLRTALFFGNIYIITEDAEENVVMHLEDGSFDDWRINDKGVFNEKLPYMTTIRQVRFLEHNERFFLINGVTSEWYELSDKRWHKVIYDGSDDAEYKAIRFGRRILPLNLNTNVIMNERIS